MHNDPIVKTKCISRIWAHCKSQGVSKEDLYLLIHTLTGSESMSALSVSQLVLVIEKLEGKKKAKKITSRGGFNVSFFPSRWQKEKVSELLEGLFRSNVIRNKEAYLQSVCLKISQKEFQKMDGKQIQKVIEALKSIQKRSLAKGEQIANNK